MRQHQPDYLRHFGAARPSAAERKLVFDAIQAHENRVPQIDIIFPVVVSEVRRRRHPTLVRLLDDYLHLTRRCLLDLDTDDALLRPGIHLPANLVFSNVIGPGDAFVRRRADIVFAAESTKVRA